ncbi:MAG: tRNA-dihydrouridine synthase family protein [Bacteroidaceae bacterium]|nr:tRNA-dihydrouridine synthase family protein [Bacteroidaceae bacterium]
MNLYFAPLQGFTEDAYRRIHNRLVGGVEAYYTPFIRLEHGGLRSKDLRDIRPEFNEGVNVIPQIIANGGDEFRTVLDAVRRDGYDRIDINMGCPFTLQARHGRGAGILPHPDKVREICDIVKATPDVRFSVKMRLGNESAEEWKDILPVLNDTPLVNIAVHPRVATQQYKGDVDMAQFEAILAQSQHPVIYNGDVCTLDDIRRMEAAYPSLAGIMIGRGLLARPSLAREYAEGGEWTEQKCLQLIRRIHDELLEHHRSVIPSEDQLLGKIRTYWEYMEPTLGKKAYKKIMKAGNLKNYLLAVAEVG